jgi:lysophospholipase L1-like esterase
MHRATILLAVMASLATVSAQGPAPANKWEPDIRTFEERDRKSPPQPGSVVFVGSSSIRMWTSLAEDFPSANVVNRGFGGSEIPDSSAFAERIVTPYRPRMVVLYAGDNDLANGRTPAQVRDDFEAFVKRVRRDLPKVRIAFISIKPSLAREGLLDEMRDANARVRAYTEREEGLVYVDVFTPMLTKDGRPRPELFLEDGLHLNRTGYELWTKVIGPYLR